MRRIATILFALAAGLISESSAEAGLFHCRRQQMCCPCPVPACPVPACYAPACPVPACPETVAVMVPRKVTTLKWTIVETFADGSTQKIAYLVADSARDQLLTRCRNQGRTAAAQSYDPMGDLQSMNWTVYCCDGTMVLIGDYANFFDAYGACDNCQSGQTCYPLPYQPNHGSEGNWCPIIEYRSASPCPPSYGYPSRRGRR